MKALLSQLNKKLHIFFEVIGMPKKEKENGGLIPLKNWIAFMKKLNARSDSVWTLLFNNGVCIGVRKLRPKAARLWVES